MVFSTLFFSTNPVQTAQHPLEVSVRPGSCVLVRWWCILLCALACSLSLAQEVRTDSLRLHKTEDGLQLSTNLTLDLPASVTDALLKGISVVFVSQVNLLKERWYWYDKSVVTAMRHQRLSYQPLTRRWRLQVSINAPGGQAGFSQQFETLTAALNAITRISKWKIADWADIETDTKYTVDFRFHLDTTQLPRPFQIGISTSGEWNLGTSKSVRFTHDGKWESGK